MCASIHTKMDEQIEDDKQMLLTDLSYSNQQQIIRVDTFGFNLFYISMKNQIVYDSSFLLFDLLKQKRSSFLINKPTFCSKTHNLAMVWEFMCQKQLKNRLRISSNLQKVQDTMPLFTKLKIFQMKDFFYNQFQKTPVIWIDFGKMQIQNTNMSEDQAVPLAILRVILFLKQTLQIYIDEKELNSSVKIRQLHGIMKMAQKIDKNEIQKFFLFLERSGFFQVLNVFGQFLENKFKNGHKCALLIDNLDNTINIRDMGTDKAKSILTFIWRIINNFTCLNTQQQTDGQRITILNCKNKCFVNEFFNQKNNNLYQVIGVQSEMFHEYYHLPKRQLKNLTSNSNIGVDNQKLLKLLRINYGGYLINVGRQQYQKQIQVLNICQCVTYLINCKNNRRFVQFEIPFHNKYLNSVIQFILETFKQNLYDLQSLCNFLEISKRSIINDELLIDQNFEESLFLNTKKKEPIIILLFYFYYAGLITIKKFEGKRYANILNINRHRFLQFGCRQVFNHRLQSKISFQKINIENIEDVTLKLNTTLSQSKLLLKDNKNEKTFDSLAFIRYLLSFQRTHTIQSDYIYEDSRKRIDGIFFPINTIQNKFSVIHQYKLCRNYTDKQMKFKEEQALLQIILKYIPLVARQKKKQFNLIIARSVVFYEEIIMKVKCKQIQMTIKESLNILKFFELNKIKKILLKKNLIVIIKQMKKIIKFQSLFEFIEQIKNLQTAYDRQKFLLANLIQEINIGTFKFNYLKLFGQIKNIWNDAEFSQFYLKPQQIFNLSCQQILHRILRYEYSQQTFQHAIKIRDHLQWSKTQIQYFIQPQKQNQQLQKEEQSQYQFRQEQCDYEFINQEQQQNY